MVTLGNARAATPDWDVCDHIEGLSWSKYNEPTQGWGQAFKSDEELWDTWKQYRSRILADYAGDVRRPRAYWLGVLDDSEPMPHWYAEQAFMLLHLGLCLCRAAIDEVDDRAKIEGRPLMAETYAAAKAAGRW